MSFGTTGVDWTAVNLATAHYVPRRSVAANPVPRANLPRTNNNNFQRLSALLPTAVNLLHEMFHLVLGNAATYSAVGEVYELFIPGANNAQVVGLNYMYAVENPESYALAAIAHDYTTNIVPNAAGNRIEFYTGYTTQD